MIDQAHRGARPAGPGTGVDRRLEEINDALRLVEAGTDVLGQTGFLRDPLRVAQTRMLALSHPGRWVYGVIVHALPHVNWYKVQAGDGAGFLPACKLEHSSLLPLGPRDTGVLPPNSAVLLYVPPGLSHGIIAGALPPALTAGTISNPDWLVQGGGSGLKREDAHRFPIKSLYRSGGVIDWSANRPADETAFMRGWIAATGLAISLDDFQVMMRVNEQCGLFLSLFDAHARLAGQLLDIESLIHAEQAGDDEGEARYFHGVAVYPWEALGLYRHGEDFTKLNDDAAIQYDLHEGKVDAATPDLKPIYRSVRHGGYLGQGGWRSVLRPAKSSGLSRYPSKDVDEGLFRESIGLDGSFSLISAKRVHIGKRCKLIQPREVRPADHGEGDDAGAPGYKFSGLFGSGPEHRVFDVPVPGEARHLRLASGVLDLLSYIINWQALHPFHYHQGDYSTPQESAQGQVFSRVMEALDFTELEDGAPLADPTPRLLNIDHRYGDVAYFERESFLIFHDEGSVQLGCGYGAHLLFGGGNVTVEAPGRVMINPGTDLQVRAGQVCINSHGSMDLSCARGDFRAKADGNMQLLAGNSGRGSLLLENKSIGLEQDYQGKFGEDVSGAGIVFRAARSACSILAQDIYLRTGGGDLGEGDITLDASAGRRKCFLYAREVNFFTTDGVQFGHGPVGASSEVSRVYHFGARTCVMDAQLYLRDKLIGYGESSGIVVNGGVYGTRSFATAGVMADRNGSLLGKVPSTFAASLNRVVSETADAVEELREFSGEKHRLALVEKYYQPGGLGEEDTISSLQFSFRDPPDSTGQYHTEGLILAEPRWVGLARFGLAQGGQAWREPPVVCQGEETYPWPGRRKWLEDAIFLRPRSLELFDAEKGIARDRPGPYEQADLDDFESVTMAAGTKTNR